MTPQSFEDLTIRVTRLERRTRVWQRVAGGLALVIVAAGVVAFRSAVAPEY
jgi:hypothetical protein